MGPQCPNWPFGRATLIVFTLYIRKKPTQCVFRLATALPYSCYSETYLSGTYFQVNAHRIAAVDAQ